MQKPRQAAALVGDQVTKARVLLASGIVKPYGPRKLAKLALTLKEWGVGPAGGFAALAVRAPDEVGLVDELGELTWKQLDERGTALADSLREMGVDSEHGVAIMARNHRYFIDALIAASKLGGDILFLNTAFSGPQLVEVMEREGPKVIVFDEEFSELVEEIPDEIKRVVAWVEDDEDNLEAPSEDATTIEALIEKGSATADLEAPESQSRIVILTSGTTGTPKGAPRSDAGVDAAVSLLSRMPLRRGWTCHIAAPLFHTWGFAHLALAMLLQSKVVLRRKFDPEQCLETMEEHDVDSLVVIPVMMQRIFKLGDDKLARFDFPNLKVVAASGSALPGDLGTKWMDTFGDNLYNIYGSTEVAYATVATPQDLREAPGTAGKPPHATIVKIFDEDGNEVEQGKTGRIFVGNGILFEGYTGGEETKDMIDGLMSSGDVGRFDEQGHLFVEGRDDEMIVSGGENVFPKEVEDCLAKHDAVHEVACIGVDDEDYGKRLKAFVVLEDGKDASEDDLKGHVKSNLARYKVPREIEFLDELPRNATGKVLKRKLEGDGDDDSDSAATDGDGDAG
ncbi:AMP-binding protein [Nocardioides marmoribigeumensis]|uniref:Fatty-acyl-CoA synthase n=1 Tax=Nocardioides marmoribigeumensis TaxID=433649 RepID=A0ABU2BQ55_9ACTN|nr:AMP-binding protein [Nocardioides marmoribigeumensis]MDR7360759.1 fatty-acyl-CoA synthase [Nocardioides marmoribigeumensis]